MSTVFHAPLDNVLVLPADLVAQPTNSAVLAAGLQSKDPQGLGNDHLLLLIVGGRDTLEDLEALKGGGATGGLVGNHAANGLVEDPGRSAEVEGTWASQNRAIGKQSVRGNSTHHRGSG